MADGRRLPRSHQPPPERPQPTPPPHPHRAPPSHPHPRALLDFTLPYFTLLHLTFPSQVGWTEVALPFLQRECNFEEGELTVVLVHSYGSLSHLLESGREPLDGRGRWLIRDAKRGVVREGTQSSRWIGQQLRRPSDWAGLAQKGA